MAREIVRKELKWVGSRLWIQSEFCDVLNRIEVTEAVEVLVLLLEKSSEKVHMDSESLGRMTKLRILQICYQELKNLENTLNMGNFRIWGTLEYLSNKLRLFYWHGCPLKFLPSEFYPVNIVAIDMSYSRIESLWTIPKCFTKLRSMTLRHCRNLKKTPDFTEITNLEKLILEGCVALVEVHPSIGMLKKLVVLNMRNCESLMSFPFKVEMDSLEVLIISGCSKVEKWPKVSGTIKTSSSGWISTFVPSSILCKLQHPQSFVLPSFVSSRFLRELNVSYCNISELSPETFEGLSSLQRLNLSGNNFTSLPASLSQLSQLATF
ncbi:hypothetical protein L6452_08849 [Arctium lappa]|uniref:Uncharacterized protein n=1 Tax=Arctium lappa TaxID=4217 RepID=A0ACB9DIV4_ARCLA|nr:hypothetical protein L6452_08849 [Arctium lappa]